VNGILDTAVLVDVLRAHPPALLWLEKQRALRFKLSHNIDIIDCLIASTAGRLSLPLFTRNLKHFVPLIGPLAHAPY
jgi:predicted nucleic acid-binding protein